jgi:phage terminase large subunit
MRKRKMNETAMLEGEERKKAEEQQRIFYSTHPLDWIVDRLRVPRETIDWQLLPEYKNHKWDGTPNPIITILDSLVNKKWVGVEGATGTNKTFMAACIALWFLECFEESMVVTIAPKELQLSLHLWKEVSRLYPRFGRGKLMNLELRMREEATGDEGWKMIGFVAGVKAEEVDASATKAQGFHGKNELFIFEETPGVADAIMTAIQNGAGSPNNIILALGNPDNQLDTLHRFCKLQRVVPVTISGFDHPNVVLKDPNFISGAQSEQGLKDMLDRYKDPNNPLYLSRARGISPKQAKEALIRYEWLIAASDRRKRFEDADGILKMSDIVGQRALGVDVANSEEGDKGAIARGIGSLLIEVEDFPCPNANKLGSQIFYEMKATKVPSEYVAVDGVGVGAGTVNELLRLGAKVVNIQSGSSPVEVYDEKKSNIKLVEEFNNLRSQMWWTLRTDLEDPASQLILPYDEQLFADLMSPKWSQQNGKIIVQSKEELKKKLGRSPNKGDAVVYWNWIRALRSIRAAQSGLTQKEEQEVEVEIIPNRGMTFRYSPKAGSKRREHSY